MVAELILVTADADAGAGKQCAQYVARAFVSTGIKVREQISLCPGRNELQKAVATALGRSNILLILGGLSLEQGQMSKAVISQGLHLPLERDENCLAAIQAYCRRTGELLLAEDESLADIPRGARAFPGRYGKVPGLVISSEKQHILLIPDNQTEAAAMLPKYILPYLSGSAAETTMTRAVRAWGVREAQARQALGDLLAGSNPAISLEQDGLELIARVSAHAPSSTEAQMILTPALRTVVERLGDAAYGIDVDSLQMAVITKMEKKHLDMAVAEAGTGGIFTRVLTETPGGADILRYSVAVEDDAAKTKKIGISAKLLKKHGGVSEQAVVAMAHGVREKKGTALGVAISASGSGTGKKSSKTSPGVVYIAVCDANNVYIRKLVVGDGNPRERDLLIDAALSRALNMVRLFIDYLPNPYKAAIPLSEALAGRLVTDADTTGDDGFGGDEEETEEGFFSRLASNFIIRKADEPKAKVRKFIFILSVLVFLGSAGYIGLYYYESWDAARQAEKFEELFFVGEEADVEIDEDFPSEYNNRFAALWSLNRDVVGYLSIEDTQVKYPVVQAGDNDYYLRRDFYKKSNQHGIPFMDYRVDLEKPSDNMVIYGHNMKDGQIFGELVNYRELDYYQEHPVFDFSTLHSDDQYKIISVFITNAYKEQGPVFAYHNFIEAKSDDDFIKFVEQLRARSIIDTPVDVQPGDKLVTLSTCTYEFTEARLVIVGRKVRPGEDASVDVSSARRNPSPLYPDIWYNLYGGTKPNVESYTVVTPAATTPPSSSSQPSTPAPSQQSSSGASSGQQSSTGGQTSSSQSQSSQSSSSTPEPESSSQPESSSSVPEASRPESSQSEPESSREPSLFDNLPGDPPSDDEDDDYEGYIVVSAPGGGSTDKVSYANVKLLPLSSQPSIFDGLDFDPRSGQSASSPAPPPAQSGGSLFDSPRFQGSGSSSSSSGQTVNTRKAGELTVQAGGKRVTGDAADIVARIVQVEMGQGFHEEAIKAQAVAAYSYIAYHNDKGQVPSVFLAKESEVHDKVRQLTEEVIGEAVYYQGKVAFTPYHATSAGQTTSSADVWGGSYPYLISVESPACKQATHYKVKRTFSSSEVESLLSSKLGIETWGDPGDWFEVLDYTTGGYVGQMSVCGETKSQKTGNTITGRMLRENVLGLRSHYFTIDYNTNKDAFTFITYGYGHGVGMSQNGANVYGKNGWSYVEILEHYYPGTVVR